MTSDLPPTGGQQPPPEPEPRPSSGPAGTTTAAGRSTRQHLDDGFSWIRSLGVIRADEGRWGPGVAAGLARRLDIDVTLIRGLFVVLALFGGGLGGVIYGLGWLLLPQEDGRIHLQEAIRGRFSAGFVGAAIVSVLALGGGGGNGPWHHGPWFWGFPGGLLLTGLVLFGIWWVAIRDTTPNLGGPNLGGPNLAGPNLGGPGPAVPYGTAIPPYGAPTPGPAGEPVTAPGRPSDWQRVRDHGQAAWQKGWDQGQAEWQKGMQKGMAGPSGEPRPKSARELARQRSAPSKPLVRLTLGAALLVAAALLVIGNQADWSAPVGVIAGAAALAVIAAGVIVSGMSGRRAAGLISLGLLVAMATLAGAGAHEAGIRSGQNLAVVGSQTWRPSTADLADSQFNLGVGEATLWLTNPAILAGATPDDPLRVSARVGAGHLIVVVPDGVATRLEIQLGAGEVVHPDGNTVQVNDGRNRSRQVEDVNTGPAGRPLLIVSVQQGVGQLEIRTATQAAGLTPTPTPATAPAPTATAVTAPAAPAPTPTKKN